MRIGPAADRVAPLLFRWRPVTGFIGFVLVFVFGQGTLVSCLAGLPVVLAGLLLRFWAAGYIGADGRAGEIGGKRYVRDGPYRWFKLTRKSQAGHPLYAGNFLLVVGMLLAFQPASLVAVLVILAFVFEYCILAWSEERHFIRQLRLLPAGSVEFEFRRALGEWRTWIVVVVAWVLALARVRSC